MGNNEEIGFSTWKDFGRHVLSDQDAIKKNCAAAKHDLETRIEKNSDKIEALMMFKSKVEVIGTIAIVILGSLEGFVALYLIFSK